MSLALSSLSAMTEIVAKAFLSYARSDDEREGGRISRLAGLIEEEFETLTGTKIRIFVDTVELRWGDDFRAQLESALQETAFFIPVLTPTYFLRDETRKEMRQFVNSAKALGLDKLLLSVRYTDVEDLVEGSTDDLKDVAARMQYEPWDDLRLKAEDSPEYRTAVNRLARRPVDLTKALEVQPVSAGSKERVAAEENDDDAPGLIDLVSDLEPATKDWTAIIGRLTPAMTEFNARVGAATERMNEANNKPNSFARKIAITRELVQEAEPSIAEIESLSKSYTAGLARLDPAVRAILNMVIDQPESEGAAGMLTSLQNLLEVSRESASKTTFAADAARKNQSLSRDLRPLLRRFETAMRNIADGQVVLETWSPLIEEAERAVAPLK